MKKILRSIGLMSGTSMDGIDATLLATDGEKFIKPIAYTTINYDPEFKLALRKAEEDSRKTKINAASEAVIKKSTELHAEIVFKLLNIANLLPHDIDVIGYHGQSLYHNPQEGLTIQMGDGELLNELTGINVVNNFRIQDIKNGGQGAPLAPIYHQALAMRDGVYPLAVVNCGGIANISIINGSNDDQVLGFDTGPGNVLIDRYIRLRTGNKEFMDKDGKYGLQGRLNQDILSKLMAQLQPYIDKVSPKSLDPSEIVWSQELERLNIYDACVVLEAFTAKSIVESVKEIPNLWVLAGGGWNNPVITKYLKHYLLEKNKEVEVKFADEMGWSGSHMEAEIFAYLAVRSLYKLPISLPSVTGASIPSLGGNIIQKFCSL